MKPIDIEAIKCGNEEAFRSLYNDHIMPLCLFSCKRIKNYEESMGIANKAMFKMWEKRADFDNPQKLMGYLYAICRNACIDYVTALRKNKLLEFDKLNDEPVTENTIVTQIAEAELLEEIYQGIKKLPKQRGQVLTLYYIHEYSIKQIAKILKRPEAMIRTVRLKGLQQLRGLLNLRQL